MSKPIQRHNFSGRAGIMAAVGETNQPGAPKHGWHLKLRRRGCRNLHTA